MEITIGTTSIKIHFLFLGCGAFFSKYSINCLIIMSEVGTLYALSFRRIRSKSYLCFTYSPSSRIPISSESSITMALSGLRSPMVLIWSNFPKEWLLEQATNSKITKTKTNLRINLIIYKNRKKRLQRYYFSLKYSHFCPKNVSKCFSETK